MTTERYNELMETGASVSPQEFHEGWHYCCEFDGLLMQLGDMRCECAPWKPVAMAKRMQELSQTQYTLTDCGEF